MSGRPFRSGIGKSRVAVHPWPEDCFIQGGENGLVVEKGTMESAIGDAAKGAELVAGALGAPLAVKHYRTAFFEAFPSEPKTFLRGEGVTIEEAEERCWAQFLRIKACAGHDFERKSYKDGCGICRHCGLFSSSAFDTTLTPCVVCETDKVIPGKHYTSDRHGRWYCPTCKKAIKQEDKSDIQLMCERMQAEDRK